MKSTPMFCVLVTLVGLLATANCLTCYQCDSTSTNNCLDDFNSEGIETANCTSGLSCFKAESTVLGIDIVSRGCGGQASECTEIIGIETCYTTCDENLCNGTTDTSVTGVLFLVMCAVVARI